MKVADLKNGHTTKMRLELDLNDAGVAAGIPKKVCLKSNWATEFAIVTDIHELEARFYHHVAGKLSIPAARPYYADWDVGENGQGFVMMEDLAAEGGVFGSSTQHVGVDGAATALGTLADLHASWWGSPKLDEHAWLPVSMDTPVDSGQLRIMYSYVERNLANPKYETILPRWMYDDPNRFHQAFDALAAFARAQSGPRCIVHGDSHLGNSYVRPNGERVWLDWQLVRKGHPWRDITYLMLNSLTIEERRSHERELIRGYREALVSKGCKDVLSADQIFEQYRRWPVYGMQSWVANVDEWGQSGFHITERFFTACEDLGTMKLLLG
jgi:hypothetical protein